MQTFSQPHLVTVTDTRLTNRKFVVNVFPKDFNAMARSDSNPGAFAPDPDALTTRPQRPQIVVTELNYSVSYCMLL